MDRLIRRRLWLASVILGLVSVFTNAYRLDSGIKIIPKNVNGFLVNRDGQFFVQPSILINESLTNERTDQSIEFHQLEITSPENEEEFWKEKSEEDKTEVQLDSIDIMNISDPLLNIQDEDENQINSDDRPWQNNRKSWWQNYIIERSRARGFSILSVLESAVSSMTKFFKNFIINEDSDDDYQGNGVSYQNHQLLRVMPKNSKQVEYLRQLRESEPNDVKFWSFPVRDKIADLVVSPAISDDVKDFLEENKIEYTTLISDLQKVIASQNPRMPKERRQDLFSSQGHSMTWKRYHRYKDIIEYLDYLALKYPQLVEVSSIGKSFEGRALKIIKISTGADKNGEPKPSIWIDAGIHAREWISTAVATYIINQLVEKRGNYSRLLEITDWIVMPIANPDGYEYTHTNDRLWRKTRSSHNSNFDEEARQNSGFFDLLTHYTKWLFGSCEGVDANRNFNIHWGEDKVNGASKDPCHETYAGPHPFSEPETKAIANYILKNKKTIRTYLTLHSYSQMLLVPWGFTRTRPTDFEDLMNIANKAKKAIAKAYGTEYKVGPAAELLYPTTGSSDDWAKAVAGVKNVFTMELRDRGVYGFLLPASQIIPTARETWAGVRIIARMAVTNNTKNF